MRSVIQKACMLKRKPQELTESQAILASQIYWNRTKNNGLFVNRKVLIRQSSIKIRDYRTACTCCPYLWSRGFCRKFSLRFPMTQLFICSQLCSCLLSLESFSCYIGTALSAPCLSHCFLGPTTTLQAFLLLLPPASSSSCHFLKPESCSHYLNTQRYFQSRYNLLPSLFTTTWKAQNAQMETKQVICNCFFSFCMALLMLHTIPKSTPFLNFLFWKQKISSSFKMLIFSLHSLWMFQWNSLSTKLHST